MAQVFGYLGTIFIAPLAPALLVGCLSLFVPIPDAGAWVLVQVALATYAVVLGHAVILGLPTLILFVWLGWVNAFAAAAAGFLIGALPAALSMTFFPSSHLASVGSFFLTAPWSTTQRLVIFASFGLLGVVGGLAAWAIWRLGDKLPRPRSSDA